MAQTLSACALKVNLTSKQAAPRSLRAACAPRAVACKTATVCTLESKATIGRREATTAGFAALTALVLPVGEAEALFGGKSREERYTEETQAAIDQINYTIGLAKTDPARPQAIKDLKNTANDWVSRYRRDDKIGGRPSYGYVYSVFNAVQGHYNNFGTKAPIPKKRAARIVKELKDAELALSRGR
ncbi:hypothetical protein CYMTET_52958 [Cymbomonas tetramitiformis]|uniref:Uncharacterized protein n=1 Tax=Cymbomonas tetramitiformis TaxID=36881 RepID=A0AAE0EQA3_9CHLO|nr:hypothetical protein CYMTET_52958 [Cymbomonas tetramitiformis]